MTATVFILRRKSSGKTAAGRVAYEAPHAVRAGIRHVASLDGLSIWQRFVIVILKLVAILGYLLGKWRSYVTPVDALRHLHDTKQLVADAVRRAISAAVPMQQEMTLGGRPLIAVVVPVFCAHSHDQTHLMAALDALSRQTRQPDYLVLVDDGSPLCIPSIISGARVLVIRLDINSGPAVARNAGIAAARKLSAHLIAFLDADCIPEPNWLGCMERAQHRHPGIVAGRTMSTRPHSYVGLYHDVCGTLNGRQLETGLLLYGCTCNLSIDLKRNQMIFDDSFPQAAFEDVEFCVRASKSGVHLCYDADAVVRHHYDTTAVGLFRQFARYGQFETTMCRLHPDYLTLLYASNEISSLSAAGLKLSSMRNSPPSDRALYQEAHNGGRCVHSSRGSLFSGQLPVNGR